MPWIRILGLISTAFLVFLLVDWRIAVSLFQDVDQRVLMAVFLVALARVWLTSLRWRLLNPDPSGQLKQWDYFRYSMIGNLFNLVMPGALGGDIVRSSFLVKELSTDRAGALFSLVVDRVVGLLSILGLGTVACYLAQGLEGRGYFLASLLLLDAVLLVALIGGLSLRIVRGLQDRFGQSKGKWGRVATLLNTWGGTVRFYRSHPLRFLGALVLCLPIHVSWFIIVFWLASEVGIEISFLALSMVSALAWLVTAMPISFGGLGVRELSFISLLSTQGIAPEPSALLGLFQFGVITVVALLGLPLLWSGRRAAS